MNDDILTRSINKGIPANYMVPVLLRYIDLEEIFEDKASFVLEIDKQIEDVLDKIIPNREGFRFMRTFEVKTNSETLEREIVSSPSAFVNSLIFCLNCHDVCHNADFLLNSNFELANNEYYKRIKRLSKIKNDEEFEREFPYLYALYFNEKEVFKPYIDFRQKYLTNPSVSNEVKLRLKAAFWREYGNDVNNHNNNFLVTIKKITSSLYKLDEIDSNTLEDSELSNQIFEEIDRTLSKYNIKTYTSNLSKNILWMVQNQDDIIDKLYNNTYDFSFLNEKDYSKLELYITYMHIKSAEISNDIDDKQKHLYYIANYFFENKNMYDTDLSLIVEKVPSGDEQFFRNSEGVVITPKSLYSRYRKLLIDNPDLRVVDSSKFDFSNMSLDDVDKFMNEYLKDLSLNWDFLPPGDFEDVPNVPTRGVTGKVLTDEELERIKRRTTEIFMEKKEFYGSTNPMYRIKGKSTFDGYIGYIYPNGKVVLDKFFDNAEKGIISYGNAVYVMNLDEFHELSKQSKSKIINEKLGRRFYHTGDWQERVRKEITGNTVIDKHSCKDKLVKSYNIID